MIIEWTEWLGYIASVIVAVSLTMTNIRRLRLINLIGAITFTIYGAVLQLYPIIVVNGFIVCEYLLSHSYCPHQRAFPSDSNFMGYEYIFTPFYRILPA